MLLPLVQMLFKVASNLVSASSLLFFWGMTAALVSNIAGGSLASSAATRSSNQIIDLIEGLQIYNSTYTGLSLVPGFPHFNPAIFLTGDSRHVELPRPVLQEAARLLAMSNEFTFLASIRQEPRNSGSILSFSLDGGATRILELQSSGRKGEIRFHYRHQDNAYTEAFRHQLADSAWHQLALSVSGTQVELFVDCQRVEQRTVLAVDRADLGAQVNASLWLGQRSAKHFLFKGYLQNVKIVAQAHGYLIQCPHLETACPTCGEFQRIQSIVSKLEQSVQLLEKKLMDADIRLKKVEDCECFKSCHINGSVHPDGATWKRDCDICSCVHGQVTCRPVHCPRPSCKNPETVPGECCPVCKKQCLINGRVLEHKEKISRQCYTCVCYDGTVSCKHIDPKTMCPPLDCPAEKQFTKENECCSFCQDNDYCLQGHDCHANATCKNQKTKYKCECNPGFWGKGRDCQDINECAQQPDRCGSNATCVNTLGSYSCECLQGFVRDGRSNCIDIDECQSKQHTCHENAVCVNTPGSVKCQCNPGYKGNGFACDPVCTEPCQNGGKCVGPNTCSCRRGYTGPRCEQDIDECESGEHRCQANSKCMNMHGWYYCQCKEGYQSKRVSLDFSVGFAAVCQDIDECDEDLHTCHDSSVCVNDNGGYHCECRDSERDNETCSYRCMHHGIERSNGETWSSQLDACSRCTCNKGVVTCQEAMCECKDAEVDLDCCPHCDKETRCHKQDDYTITFRSGQTWDYQCQLCECMFGEVDCWDQKCPPTNCANPVRKSGDCCARCEDDPCDWPPGQSLNGTMETNDVMGRECDYEGHTYQDGEKIALVKDDPCTNCKCKNGRLCCTYSSSCASNQHDRSSVHHNRVERGRESLVEATAAAGASWPWTGRDGHDKPGYDVQRRRYGQIYEEKDESRARRAESRTRGLA